MKLKISKSIYIDVIISLILILQYFISSTYVFLFGLAYFLWIFFINRKKVSLSKNIFLLVTIFLCLALVGAINVAQDKIIRIDYIRDVFYYLSPIVFYLLGQALYSKTKDIWIIINSIFVVGIFMSLYFIFNVVINISMLFNSSVETWRSIVGYGYIESTLAIFFSYILYKENKVSSFVSIITSISCLITLLFSLSRTYIFILIVLFLIYGIKKNNLVSILKVFIITSIVLFIGLYVFSLFPINSAIGTFYTKISNSITELSSQSNWSDWDTITKNWRGYENYCAQLQWNDYSIIDKIFGGGIGTRIYVGEAGRLVYTSVSGESYQFIPVLHNVFSTLLVKGGVFGLCLYCLFILNIFYSGFKLSKYDKFYAKIYISIGIILIFVSLTVCGIYKENSFFQVVLFLGFIDNYYYQKIRCFSESKSIIQETNIKVC